MNPAPDSAPEENDDIACDAPSAAPRAPVDRAQWPRPWVQLKFFTFQPQIYPKMIRDASSDARAGDLVHVFDKLGQRLGVGFWNRKAHVPLRIMRFSAEPVGEDHFPEALARAARFRRETLGLDAVTDAYRVVNSDGDGLSGLTVDRYGDLLFADVCSLGVLQRLPQWLPVLHAALGTRRQIVRVADEVAHWEGIKPAMLASFASKDAPRRIKIREHGVVFEVDFEEGHKTGFFCDQRDNRRRFAQFTKGARVLDLCCYTGGFSLAAAASGAAEVTGVDLDETAIGQARRNANINGARIRWVHADTYAYTRQMQKNGERWDAVVLDPPKFVLSRDLGDDDGPLAGRRRYEDINQLALSLVKPGGVFVTCSCSGLVGMDQFEEYVIKAAHRLHRRLQFFDRTGPGSDHPVYSNCLDSQYLKVLWARVV